ncbi:prepilin-type N-terminal cleavage/methylation domain-containing protein [Ruficoccus amylovorans]|uniref:Prepilin-type N-terminal cleavage/methylation domain-containing protein n=1 Tax=Ruficoccus amylovorans TaxID=1804625 RepID=A0A842HC26_9BACT|nr:prepilin-type N-terminal cleavage/methylation domain-containing protein [Ruficoccus amylovorans]MBC2593810.1 prepilin-type N-terminal cleavage/methylation domain-containing protein [Ruficoccus amylovorans]
MKLPLHVNRSKLSSARGITLVEVIVVIAIVAVLTGILIAGVGRIKESANASKCLANLRQIGVASALYCVDHNQRLVPIVGRLPESSYHKTWRVHLEPYLPDQTAEGKGVFWCPSGAYNEPTNSTKASGTRPASYGINNYIGLHSVSVAQESAFISDVKNPTGTIFVADIGLVANLGDDPSDWVDRGESVATTSYGYARFPEDPLWSSDPWNVFPRHGGHVNVLFYDGHVGSLDVVTDIMDVTVGSRECMYDNE